MRSKVWVVIGALFFLVGLAALVHPQFSYPVQKNFIQAGPDSIPIETRRIIQIPRGLSAVVHLAGAALALTGLRPSAKN